MSEKRAIAHWSPEERVGQLVRAYQRGDGKTLRAILSDEGYRWATDETDVLREQLRGAATSLEALKARLRQEVDAHRMTLHPRALPFTDEEWQGYLSGIPGVGE